MEIISHTIDEKILITFFSYLLCAGIDWQFTSPRPLRLDFFGHDIENIRPCLIDEKY